MIITEKYSDTITHTYSSAGFTILQVETGKEYYEAYDHISSPYTYTETDNKRKDLSGSEAKSLVPDYEEDAVYDAGAVVNIDGTLYQCTEDGTTTSPSAWQEITE